jgi:outer membrane protein assembly factor BamB
VLETYHGGIVADKDRVFGYSDRSGWVCQQLSTGEELWTVNRRIGSGSLIRIGSRFILVLLDGRVVMTELNDDNWTVRGEFKLSAVSAPRKANLKIRVCTHPVLANGRLYVRDQERLMCYDLRAK